MEHVSDNVRPMTKQIDKSFSHDDHEESRYDVLRKELDVVVDKGDNLN